MEEIDKISDRNYYRNKGGRVYVKVIPRSSLNKIEKTGEGEYKIKLTAPPIGGKANEMLVKILAKYFNVPKSLIEIIGGKSARTKIVDILS